MVLVNNFLCCEPYPLFLGTRFKSFFYVHGISISFVFVFMNLLGLCQIINVHNICNFIFQYVFKTWIHLIDFNIRSNLTKFTNFLNNRILKINFYRFWNFPYVFSIYEFFEIYKFPQSILSWLIFGNIILIWIWFSYFLFFFFGKTCWWYNCVFIDFASFIIKGLILTNQSCGWASVIFNLIKLRRINELINLHRLYLIVCWKCISNLHY